MADYNVTLKDENSNNLYPTTQVGNVLGLSDSINAVSNAKADKTYVDAGLSTKANANWTFTQIGAMSGYSDGNPSSAYSYGYWNNGTKTLAGSIANAKAVAVRVTQDNTSISSITIIPMALFEYNRGYTTYVHYDYGIAWNFDNATTLRITARAGGCAITGVWAVTW